MERQAKDGTIYKQVGQDEWAPVTREAKDGTTYKKVGADDWAPMEMEPKKEEFGAGEAFLRSFSNSALGGYGDRIIAAGKGVAEDIGDMFTGDRPDTPKPVRDEFGRVINAEELDPGYFDKNLEETIRKREMAASQNPISGGAGTIAGFLVPGLAAAKGVRAARGAMGLGAAKTLGQKAGTLAAEGAVLGGGYAPEGDDLVNIPQRVENAATGAAFGAVMPYAGKAIKGAAKGVAKLPKKALSSFGGVAEENIEAFLKNPKRFANSKTREEIINTVATKLDDIEQSVVKGKAGVQTAKENLKTLERSIKEGGLDKQQSIREAMSEAKARLNDSFKVVQQELKEKAAPTKLVTDIEDSLNALKKRVSEGSKKSYELLGDEGIDANKAYQGALKIIKENTGRGSDAAKSGAKKVKEYADLLWSKGRTENGKFQVSGKELKNLLRDLDSDISNWENATGAFDDPFTRAMKGFRAQIDDALKSQNPKYKAQMAQVARDAKLLSKASKNFGQKERAFSKLSNIAGKKGVLDRALLKELGDTTGNDFVSTIDDYVKTQRTLKSPVKMDSIKQSLPEYDEIRKLQGEASVLKRLRKGKNLRQKIKGSKQFRDLKQAEFDLKKAEQLKKKFVGWSERTAEDKINQVMRGKRFVSKQLDDLSKLSDEDLVKAVEELKVNEAFTKDATRGSRNVNLWSIIGLASGGGVLGGPVGAALGATLGSMIDKYGPKLTKQILKGVAGIKGRPTLKALQKANIPDNVSRELMDMLYGAALTGKAAAGSAASKVADNEPRGKTKWAMQGYDNILDNIEDADLKMKIYENKDKILKNRSNTKILLDASRLKDKKKIKNLMEKLRY